MVTKRIECLIKFKSSIGKTFTNTICTTFWAVVKIEFNFVVIINFCSVNVLASDFNTQANDIPVI